MVALSQGGISFSFCLIDTPHMEAYDTMHLGGVSEGFFHQVHIPYHKMCPRAGLRREKRLGMFREEDSSPRPDSSSD